MTAEQVLQALSRQPFRPLRFHLADGKVVDSLYPNTAFVAPRSVVVVHPFHRNTARIREKFDCIDLRLIERVEQLDESAAP